MPPPVAKYEQHKSGNPLTSEDFSHENGVGSAQGEKRSKRRAVAKTDASLNDEDEDEDDTDTGERVPKKARTKLPDGRPSISTTAPRNTPAPNAPTAGNLSLAPATATTSPIVAPPSVLATPSQGAAATVMAPANPQAGSMILSPGTQALIASGSLPIVRGLFKFYHTAKVYQGMTYTHVVKTNAKGTINVAEKELFLPPFGTDLTTNMTCSKCKKGGREYSTDWFFVSVQNHLVKYDSAQCCSKCEMSMLMRTSNPKYLNMPWGGNDAVAASIAIAPSTAVIPTIAAHATATNSAAT